MDSPGRRRGTATVDRGKEDAPQVACGKEDKEDDEEPPLSDHTRPVDSREEILSSDVWLHVYHCDPYTGFLNQLLLKQKEIGIYHTGIEVYGEEWSFQYFEDTWDDPTVSGLIRCMPKCMAGYEYQESLNLGPTTLTPEEVDQALLRLHHEWPACSYHLTHNNCLSFAEYFAGVLKVPTTFPAQLKGILEASRNNASIDAVVDYGWSWSKWWMLRKHRQPDERVSQERPGNVGEQHAGVWSFLLHPAQTCSASLCVKPPSRSDRASKEHCICPTPVAALPVR